ncbi:MAG: hypothetical protein FWH41_03645 [Treponema sp.]|nr:hypothetical protein [Treponema sp.]
MTRTQSLLFRTILFLAGAGIIVMAFFLSRNEKELTGTDAFIWTSIGIMYLVLSLPSFFSIIRISNFSSKIPYLALLWLGIILYLILSIILIVILAVFPNIITLNTAIIIQSILLFLFAVIIFLASYASGHVRAVAKEEAAKLHSLSQIKQKAQSLLLTVNKLPSEYANAQKIIQTTIEDVKYIYPVNNWAGEDLEIKILQSINVISELCSNFQSGAQALPDRMNTEAEGFNMLVKERKLLRN